MSSDQSLTPIAADVRHGRSAVGVGVTLERMAATSDSRRCCESMSATYSLRRSDEGCCGRWTYQHQEPQREPQREPRTPHRRSAGKG
jgi:hypothetical protein